MKGTTTTPNIQIALVWPEQRKTLLKYVLMKIFVFF